MIGMDGKVKFIFIVMAGVLWLSGCSTVVTSPRPASYYQNQGGEEVSSLFSDNVEGLSDESIKNILSYRLALPEANRIAVLNLSQNNYWRYYSSDFVRLDEEVVSDLITHLKASERVYDASFLPSLLVPGKKTLPVLRAAAARYQADLLLAYRSQCQSFSKYQLLNPNISRAYCTVEAVVLDVRSGIVPFTVVSTNEYTAEMKRQDVDLRETKRKAEMKAIGVGLKEVSVALRNFVEGLPTL